MIAGFNPYKQKSRKPATKNKKGRGKKKIRNTRRLKKHKTHTTKRRH